MASAESDQAPGKSTTRKLTFLDLPPETQKEIIGHVDLICVSLVSKYFRELAAAQLYRNFHIVFPDEDDPTFDSPIDGLAGGLDTFVTSDYNYARHLKDLSLDTLSAGDKAENAYKPYLFSVSCGKFMNTLLLLTLRKAASLESFRWNIRVELSRPVYKALHQINTLNRLHIRMQAGPSLFETPPSLPYPTNSPSTSSGSLWADPPPPPQPTLPLFGLPPPPTGTLTYTAPSGLPPTLPKPSYRNKATKKSSSSKEPPTLSGFRNLQSLSVLDVDSLDMIDEIKACVKSSASTLTKLKISFSDSLASQARKPPPDADPDDSDADDEFQVVPIAQPPGFGDDGSGPAKAFRAQQEKKTQEEVLGRIFDVEPPISKSTQGKKSLKGKEKETKESSSATESTTNEARDEFVKAILALSEKLKPKEGESYELLPNDPHLPSLICAARAFFNEEASQTADKKPANDDRKTDAEAETSTAEAPELSEPASVEAEQASSSSLFDTKATKSKDAQRDLKPEDIDIEQPIEPEESDDLAAGFDGKDDPRKEHPKDDDAASFSSSTSAKPTPAGSSMGHVSPLATTASSDLEALRDDVQGKADAVAKEVEYLATSTPTSDHESLLSDAKLRLRDYSETVREIVQMMGQLEERTDGVERSKATEISDYVRSTRGLALKSLSIHLVPVKASVLSRAVDLTVLKRLTLLNVGAQGPIWTLLAKENKTQPLPLRKIFTDNVSTPFLTCVAQLPELHELFMLERSTKYKPESFAPKTAITIEQIRRQVLRRHIGTLRKLMIKNDGGGTWDVDEKTMLLICNRGAKLEELAVSMGIRAVHTFMQHLSGLVNLRALNIMHFRNEDTCVWVMRETRRFIIDNLSHFPELKLEWISIDDDRVERIIRAVDVPNKEREERKQKKKDAAKTKSPSGLLALLSTNLPGVGLSTQDTTADGWDSQSDSDDDDVDDNAIVPSSHLKLETIEGVHFYDVWGVRIFKKEVMAGRL